MTSKTKTPPPGEGRRSSWNVVWTATPTKIAKTADLFKPLAAFLAAIDPAIMIALGAALFWGGRAR